jgi:hypothetical protein
VDTNGNVTEIKSKPSFARNDKQRLLETWVQSLLSGVQEIITGEFTKRGRGRYDPVQFPKHLIRREPIDSYGGLSQSVKQSALQCGLKRIKKIQASCVEEGLVYLITCSVDKVTAQHVPTRNFAINSATIKAVAMATVGDIDNSIE